MKITLVDPRLYSTSCAVPFYRVDFWWSDVASEEWLLQGAESVNEAIRWAEHNADGRTFVLYCGVSTKENSDLIRLLGAEPPGVGN